MLRLLGLLLFVTAALKAIGPQFVSLPLVAWASPAWVWLALLQYELFLGLWLLSGQHRPGAWLVAVGTFGLFALANAWAGWVGHASCGCLGSVPLSPWWAFAFDAGVLALLFRLARPAASERGPAGKAVWQALLFGLCPTPLPARDGPPLFGQV
jgi:hypothetical protein